MVQIVKLMRRYVQDYDPKNPRTHKGNDLKRMTMKQLFESYGLDVQTIDFIGHALALHRSPITPLLDDGLSCCHHGGQGRSQWVGGIPFCPCTFPQPKYGHPAEWKIPCYFEF